MLLARKASLLLYRCSDWFLPVQTGPEAELLTRRGRLLLLFLLLCLMNMGWTAAFQLLYANPALGLTALALIAPILAFAGALKLGVPVRVVSTLAVILMFTSTMAVVLATGGRWPGGTYFMVLVPAVAVLIVSPRAGCWWAGVTLAGLASAAALTGSATFEVPFEVTADEVRYASFRIAALLTLAIFSMAYIYSSMNERARVALADSVEKHREGERRFRALTENAHDLIAELDARGVVTYVSPGCAEAVGWPAEEVVGRPLLSYLDPEELEAARLHWARLREKGVVQQETIRVLSHHRGTRWFEFSMRSYTTMGDELRVVIVARDITERLEREKLIRHQQQLASVGAMAAGIGRQLSDPIRTILDAARRAGEGAGVDGRARERVEAAAERCDRILDSLFAFARDERAARWVEDLEPVVDRAVRAVESQRAETGAQIVLSPSDETPQVRMSPIEIEQVVINLLRNALEAKATVIVIGTEIVDPETIRLTVSDDGVGVSRVNAERLFDPYFTTRPDSGSGLGLSLAREIVEGHGGHIEWVETADEGTVFFVELPRAQERH